MRAPAPPGARPVRALFGAVATARRDRALHPYGVVLRGRFRALDTTAGRGARLLEPGTEHDAAVRFSRGAGVPEPVPDVLGCAIRLLDAHGAGRPQDFALASSFARPIGRHALVPRLSFFDAFYSSVLPYRVGGEVRLVAARIATPSPDGEQMAGLVRAAEAAGGLRVDLLLASRLGPWQAVAEVELDTVVRDAPTRRLRFNPWNSGGGIEPHGTLMALRDPAYRGSQAASPDAD